MSFLLPPSVYTVLILSPTRDTEEVPYSGAGEIIRHSSC